MAVGLSDGTGYEDNNEYLLSATQPRLDVYKGKTPDTVLNAYPGVSGTSTGALKSSGGTEVPDYDYDAWQKANPGVEMAPGQHYPDTYKLPNHMTFSDESIYHGGENQGGHWGTDDKGRDTFTPGPTNLQNHSIEEMQDYFKRVEPNGVLIPPDVHPTPDYLNPPDRDTPPAKDAPPRDDSQDIKVNPWVTITPEDINTGISVALSAGAGTMQGVKSATFDRAALYKAQNLEMDGVHPEDIWNQTGTFRGADGRWRQEIPDQDVNILDKGTNLHPAEPAGKGMAGWNKIEAPESISIKDSFKDLKPDASLTDLLHFLTNGPGQKTKLSDVLDHPELYKAYPWLKNIEVHPMPGDRLYKGMAQGNKIFMSRLPTEDFTSTLMHEVQHLVQDHEGFAHGANPDMFIPKGLKEAEVQFLKVREEAYQNTAKELKASPEDVKAIKRVVAADIDPATRKLMSPSQLKDVARLKELYPEVYSRMSNIAKSEHLLEEAKYEAADRYRRVMGEVESRNVQARLDYSHLDRAINSPMKTEELITPRSQQINSTDIANHTVGRESASAPANDNDMFGRNTFKSYKQAINDQQVRRELKLSDDAHIGDYNHWKDIAVKENHHTTITDTPNAMTAARVHSEGGKTTVLIRQDGRRLVYKDGVQVARDSYK